MGLKWNFEHSYAALPEHFYSEVLPEEVKRPSLVIFNESLAKQLGILADSTDEHALAQLFAGAEIPEDARPIAQAYAGHQFGNFTMLGDGRAHLLGEHLTPEGERFDIQFKGSGKTPYARRGDGKAALGPMLREYIISEAMESLHIPTTRSLAVVTTGEPVFREEPLPGAILTRVAKSHIRVGTFEYVAAQKDVEVLKAFADYTIARHYPSAADAENPYIALLQQVMQAQIALVVNWLRVGFIHGVMNTDNTTISGETIDYGPCAFMDAYDPQTVFSSIDRNGRYAYANQPAIIKWNMARFTETLLPLFDEVIETAVEKAEQTLNGFDDAFQTAWMDMMRKKLGLPGEEEADGALIGDLLKWMQTTHADYTNTFRDLSLDKGFDDEDFQAWQARWEKRRESNPNWQRTMQANNPAIIPRNHKVELVLRAAEDELEYAPLHTLLEMLANPYDYSKDRGDYSHPPAPSERVYQTFCGT